VTIILTLAYNVFRRERRKKALWITMSIFLLFHLAICVSSMIWTDQMVGGDLLGFVKSSVSTATTLCMILAIVVAQDTVSYEINKSTIHLILARPISPERCMAGLDLGSAISALAPYLAFSLMSLVTVAVVAPSYLVQALAALFLLALPLVLLTMIVTFFNIWMPGGFAVLVGFALFVFSFLSGSIDSWASRVNVAYRVPLRVFNLFSLRLDSYFSMVNNVIAGQGMAWRPLVWVTGYAVIIVALGILLFKFRKV
jgi:ABC-type transport system involved in multi-copper enzyme maturation permease subunit